MGYIIKYRDGSKRIFHKDEKVTWTGSSYSLKEIFTENGKLFCKIVNIDNHLGYRGYTSVAPLEED